MGQIVLAPVLDLTAAPALKQALLETGPDAGLEAGDVQRVTTPCLQLLVAAVAGGAHIENPSRTLCDTAARLDLAGALGIGICPRLS